MHTVHDAGNDTTGQDWSLPSKGVTPEGRKGVGLGATVSCDMCRMQMPDMAWLTEERERDGEREI